MVAIPKGLSAKSLPKTSVVGLLLIIAGILTLVLIKPNHNINAAAAGTYKEQLRGQVDTATGAPRDGRDPASQPQTSLADTASKPTSASKVASSATKSQSTASSTSQDGLGTNGCYIDYGIQGQECLPAHAATNGVLTCEGVHSHGFSKGIKVVGKDRYNLDTNHNGVACDSGDK